jgi:hypothetical protein
LEQCIPAILASLLYCGAGVVLPSFGRPLYLTANAPAKLPSRGTNCLWLAGACQAGAANTELPVEGLNFLSKLALSNYYRKKSETILILLPSYRLHRLEEISDDRNAGLGRIGGRRDSHRLLP